MPSQRKPPDNQRQSYIIGFGQTYSKEKPLLLAEEGQGLEWTGRRVHRRD